MKKAAFLLFLFASVVANAGSGVLIPPGSGAGALNDYSHLPQPVDLAIVPLTSTGTTNVATHTSEAGHIVGVWFSVSILPTGSDQAVTGTPDVDLVLTVDGGTAYTESIYGSNCPDTITPVCWTIPFYDSQRYPWYDLGLIAVESGEIVNTKSGFFYNVPYETSVQLDVVVNTASSDTDISMAASLVRATRLTSTGTARAEEAPRAIQTISSSTFSVDPPSGTVRTTLVNVTESGLFHGLTVHVGGANLPVNADPADSNDCDVEMTIDGNLSTQPFYDGGSGWITALQPIFSTQFSFFQSTTSPPNGGTGGQASDWVQLWYQARYQTSLLVEVVCASHGGTAGALVTWNVVRSTDI